MYKVCANCIFCVVLRLETNSITFGTQFIHVYPKANHVRDIVCVAQTFSIFCRGYGAYNQDNWFSSRTRTQIMQSNIINQLCILLFYIIFCTIPIQLPYISIILHTCVCVFVIFIVVIFSAFPECAKFISVYKLRKKKKLLCMSYHSISREKSQYNV